MSRELFLFFVGLQIIGLGIAFTPWPIEWAPFMAYVSGSLIVYCIAARRLGGWWL
jgi:uncharacterized membrane protein